MTSERSLKMRWAKAGTEARTKVGVTLGAQVGLVLAATVAGALTLGAGCSESKTTSNTVETNRATPIFGSDAGWQDAAPPELLSDTQACARYQQAVCERKNECGLATDDCAKAIVNCPDSMFSPGSTRQKETTWDCAFQMRQRSCHDVYYGVNPACVTPGTRKPGDSCVSSAQCASLACTSSGTSCGACVERIGKDKDCTDKQKVTCDRGLTCSPNSNVCVDLPEKTFDDVTTSGVAVGSPCDLGHVCTEGAYCKLDASGTDVCAVQVPLGSLCTTNVACAAGTYCAQEDGQCTKLPEANARCGNDIETGNALYCTDGNYCDQRGGYMCKPLPTDGKPCAETLRSGAPNVCAPSAACDASANPPVCVGLAAAGENCTNDSGCQTGLKCACSGASCEQQLCSFVRDIGESCATPAELCNSVSTCTDGICKANPSQNLFAGCGS